MLPNGIKLLWRNAAERLPDLNDLAETLIPSENVVEFDTNVALHRFQGDASPQVVVRRVISAEL